MSVCPVPDSRAKFWCKPNPFRNGVGNFDVGLRALMEGWPARPYPPRAGVVLRIGTA
jgi:hypothetical protein